MAQKHFPHTVPLWEESTGHMWIPLTKSINVELSRYPKQFDEQTAEWLVIRDTITPTLRHCKA